MKFIFWAVVVLAVLMVVRLLAAKSAAREREPARPANRRAARTAAAPVGTSEPMVRCAHCGIHLPRSEALLQGGRTWCSSEHASLGVRQ